MTDAELSRFISPPDRPVERGVLEELRQLIEEGRLAARNETSIHAAADANRAKLSVAIRYAMAMARRKISRDRKPDVDVVVKTMREALEGVLPKMLRKVVADGGQAAAGMLRAAEDFRAAKRDTTKRVGPLAFRFDVSNPHAIDWADRHAAELIDGITETTREAISNAIAEHLEGESWEATVAEILDLIGDEDRAERIARHETMLAAGEGQRLAWDQAVDEGLLTGDEKRTLIITNDTKLCPICEFIAQQEAVGLREPYVGEDGEEYDGPPIHVGCRCTEGITA